MRQGVTKEKVILSFLEVACEKGTGGASLSDIASALSIKKSSLYNHFESRADLVSETTKYCASFLQTVQFKALSEECSSLFELLSSALNRYMQLFEGYPLREIFTYVEAGKFYSAEIESINSFHQERIASEFASLLRMAVSKGFIKSPTIEKLDIISKTASIIIHNSLFSKNTNVTISLLLNLLEPYSL